MIIVDKITFLKKVFFRILSIPRITYAIYNFEKALNLMSIKNFVEAERVFENGQSFIKSLPYEYKIIKGRIKFNLDKREECVKLLEEAWYDLENDLSTSSEEKLYLKAYISNSLRVYKEFCGYDKSPIEFIDIQSVDLREIDDTTKRTFPVRNHPDWDKYGNE